MNNQPNLANQPQWNLVEWVQFHANVPQGGAVWILPNGHATYAIPSNRIQNNSSGPGYFWNQPQDDSNEESE